MNTRRASYKVKKVVREFNIPSPVNSNILVPRQELECGHIVRGRIGGPRSRSEAINELFKAMSGTITKRRCFECGKAALEKTK